LKDKATIAFNVSDIFNSVKEDLKPIYQVSTTVSFNGEKTIQLVVYVPIIQRKTDRNKMHKK
jgi:hypothetical protein